MKNFARLVRFALPYKLRFGLSIGCAAMVALLFFSELGAVYPLLHILFNSQNPQKWVAEKIESYRDDITSLEARQVEARYVLEVAPRGKDGYIPLLTGRRQQLEDEIKQVVDRLYHQQRGAGEAELTGDSADEKARAQIARLEEMRRDRRVAEARHKELLDCSSLLLHQDTISIGRRLVDIQKGIVDDAWWLRRCSNAQPYVNRYLPGDSFTALLLLIGLVMVGVALKGFFMFLQEVLVADVMQLTLFDIRNLFFRRTINLDLASFSDQGSSELMARFTNDMDSFGQGLNTLMSKLIREPMRIATCLGSALLFNWRLTLLTLILVPISAATTYRVGKVMKRAVRRSLESMSTIYKILQESFQGIKIVKAFAMERVERRRFFGETKNLYKKSVRVAMIDAMSDPVLEMLTLTTVAIALLAGSYLVLNRTIYLELGLFRIQLAAQPMEIQDLLTLYAWLAGVSDPIRKLANVHSKIQRASAAADRICAMMDRTPRVVDHCKHAPVLPRHRQSVELDRVGFSYNPDIARARRREPHGPPRRNDRAGGAQWLRQDDADEPAAEVLGRRLRRHPHRRPRHPRGAPAQPPPPDRHRAPGDDPVPGHDRRQHRLWRSPRAPGRHHPRRGTGLCPPVHHGAAAGV